MLGAEESHLGARKTLWEICHLGRLRREEVGKRLERKNEERRASFPSPFILSPQIRVVL